MNKKVLNILLIFTILFSITTFAYAEEDELDNTQNDITSVEEKVDENNLEDNNLDVTTNDSQTTYTNSETGYKVLIEDEANLFTDDQIAKLKDQMTTLTEYGNIILITIDKNEYSSTETFARNYYHNNFGTSSGTIFVIDMDNRYLYLFSDGANYRTITSQKSYLITDNVYRYASLKEYYECAKNVFEQVQTLLNGGKIAEPMRHISNFVLALTTSFLTCFMIVRHVSKIKAASDKEILNNCNIKFEIGSITGVKVGEHSVYNPSDSSSGGGGGSSGGGGGGGSSGGGGGHSF